MDNELWEGLLDHIKEDGEENKILSTIVYRSIVVNINNQNFKLRLAGNVDLLLGITEWEDHITIIDMGEDALIGILYDYGFTTLIKPYSYLSAQLPEIVGIMKADYQSYENRKEQEELERRKQEELRAGKVNKFLYGN